MSREGEMQSKEKGNEDYSLKETRPNIGGRRVLGSNNLTLVEQQQFLYVRIVRARDLPTSKLNGARDLLVEMKVGNHKGSTRAVEKTANPEWNQVFAFAKDWQQSKITVEIIGKEKQATNEGNNIGSVAFDFANIPTRASPDSPLAPQWYRLEDSSSGSKLPGEIMIAIWIGNQADDSFSVACHPDEHFTNIRSKVYHSPRLWYLRVNVIGAQDLAIKDKNRKPEAYVKAMFGNLVLRSRVSGEKCVSPSWNEELMFVAAEPFDDHLTLSVEDKGGKNKDEQCLGKCIIPLQQVEKRLSSPPYRRGETWVNLENVVAEGDDDENKTNKKKEVTLTGRLHVRVFLDGLYHVFDEPTYYTSDTRPTSPDLWPEKIGILELGILKAEGLLPMKSKNGRATTDAYCVAKYGNKWVRTSTIVDSFCPRWNEQYHWEVYDPYTVITIAVFDNSQVSGGGGSSNKNEGGGGSSKKNEGGGGGSSKKNEGGGGGSNKKNEGGGSSNKKNEGGGSSNKNEGGGGSSNKNEGGGGSSNKNEGGGGSSNKNEGGGGSSKKNEGGGATDPRIGKVRIRLSTLETGRIYTLSYPLIVLHPNGVKKTGELHLAVKFSCISLLHLLQTYAKPLLPPMHYTSPLSIYQLESLRHQATHLLSLRLGRADPPLRKEVVDYMLEAGPNMWSLRRGKANCERIMMCATTIVAAWRWFDRICQWKNPASSLLILLLFISVVFLPHLLFPLVFLSLFLAGMWSYPRRPRNPPHMDTKLSHAETANHDELDEEFDTYPSSKQGDVLKARYDRLRGIGGRLVVVMGDVATQMERLQSLLAWRDPRATSIFLLFCLLACYVLYVSPPQYLVLLGGLYALRFPRYRTGLPSAPRNFLRRLPARADCLL